MGMWVGRVTRASMTVGERGRGGWRMPLAARMWWVIWERGGLKGVVVERIVRRWVWTGGGGEGFVRGGGAGMASGEIVIARGGGVFWR